MWLVYISFVGLSIFHGLILSAILITKHFKGRTDNSLPISLIIIAFTLYLSEYFLILTGVIQKNPHLILASYPALFFMGPLFLRFTEMSMDRSSKAIKWLFGIPLVVLIIFLPYYMSPVAYKLSLFENFDILKEGFPIVHFISKPLMFYGYTLIFLIFSFLNIQNFTRSHTAFNANALKWFKSFIIVFGSLFFVLSIVEILSEFQNLEIYGWITFLSPIPMAVALHVLAYGLIFNPQIIDKWVQQPEVKYKKSSLSNDVIQQYLLQIEEHLGTGNPFLKNTFSIQELSRETGISKHHISQAINTGLNLSFSELINQKRIEESCKLLKLDSNPVIFHIALDVGFNNKVSFYRAFKKVMDMTPAEYLEQNKK